MADRSRIGIVTGLVAEAATLPEGDFWVAVSAANPARAAQAANAMVAGGVRLLVSYGLAAGIDPRLGPGTLLLPESVIAHEGEVEAPDRGGVRDQLQRMDLLQARGGARHAGTAAGKRLPAGGRHRARGAFPGTR